MNLLASEYIPQKPPFIMVDNILSCNDMQTVTNFKINENNIFVKDNLLQEAGIIENIAQTCAARIGYLNQQQEIRVGVIGAIKNLEIYKLVAVNEILTTTIKTVAEVFDSVIIDAEIYSNNLIIAKAEMKVFIMNEEKK